MWVVCARKDVYVKSMDAWKGELMIYNRYRVPGSKYGEGALFLREHTGHRSNVMATNPTFVGGNF